VSSRRPLLAIACALLLAAGCSSGAETGKGVDLTSKGTGGNPLIPTASPTKSPKAAKPIASAKPVATKPATTKPKPVATVAEFPPFYVTISGDKSGKALIDPPQVAVYTGTKIIWRNSDTKPHGVMAQNGAFKSGNIAPGGTFTWVAGAPGMYAYQDSTRPYVNAQIQVSPR
jgi:plastocyanin